MMMTLWHCENDYLLLKREINVLPIQCQFSLSLARLMLIMLMILWLTADDGGDDDDYDGLGDSDDGVPCDPWVRVADRDNLASRTTWLGTQHLIIILIIIMIASRQSSG